MNARLSRFATLLAKPSLNPDSVVAVLSRLLLAAEREAPSPHALATFPMAVMSTFRGASRATDTGRLFQQVVDAAGLFVLTYLNGKLLPARLLSSTYLTSPEHLVAPSRELAARRIGSLKSRLTEGGVAFG